MQRFFQHIDIELPWSGRPVPLVLVLLTGTCLFAVWLFRKRAITRFGQVILALAGTGLCIAALTGRLGWVYTSFIRVTRFGAFLLAALMVGSFVAGRLWRSAGLSEERRLKVLLSGFAFGLVGAKLSYGLLHWVDFSQLEGLWSLRRGGLEGHGALLGGSLGIAWAVRDRGEELWRWLDGAAPGLAFGAAIVSVGTTGFEVPSFALATAIFAFTLGVLLLVWQRRGRPSSAILGFGLFYSTFGFLADLWNRPPNLSRVLGLSAVGWMSAGLVVWMLLLAGRRFRVPLVMQSGAGRTNTASVRETGAPGTSSAAGQAKARSQRE